MHFLRLKGLLPILAVITLSLSASGQGTFSVDLGVGEFTNGGAGVFGSDNATPLNPGVFNQSGDGTVVQVGYFTASTIGNLFAGDWVALTGNGGLNSALATTSIGDDGTIWSTAPEAQGWIFSTVFFDVTNGGRNQGLPAGGTFLAIRFFNGTSIAASTHYNTLASPDWIWTTPAVPAPTPEIMYDSNVNKVWQGPAGFTSIEMIPEPATYAALFGLAVLGLAVMRRRR